MKRIFALILAILMLLAAISLVACKGSQQGEEETTAQVEETVESACWEGDKLCLTVNGKKRYYTRATTSSEMFSPDKTVSEFTEELEWEGIIWTVYSVKEREDLSVVFAISGTGSIWICTAE